MTIKAADQPAHPRGLISFFVIHSLESIIAKFSTCKVLFILASLCSWAECLPGHVAIPEARNSRDEAHIVHDVTTVKPE